MSKDSISVIDLQKRIHKNRRNETSTSAIRLQYLPLGASDTIGWTDLNLRG